MDKPWSPEKRWLDSVKRILRAFEQMPGKEVEAMLFYWALRLVSKNVLEALHLRFLQGDRWALSEALEVCAEAGLPLPHWAAPTYATGFRKIESEEVASWDQVLGRAPTQRKQLRGARATRAREIARNGPEIWRRIKKRSLTEAIDDSLFEQVGKEFGTSKSTCSRLYYAEEHEEREMDAWMAGPGAEKMGRLLSEANDELACIKEGLRARYKSAAHGSSY
jgi:hypothetical protein